MTNTIVFDIGQSNQTINVPVFNTPQAEGDKTVVMQLTNANNALLFTPSVATLTIVDVQKFPGEIVSAQTNYVVSEADGGECAQ